MTGPDDASPAEPASTPYAASAGFARARAGRIAAVAVASERASVSRRDGVGGGAASVSEEEEGVDDRDDPVARATTTTAGDRARADDFRNDAGDARAATPPTVDAIASMTTRCGAAAGREARIDGAVRRRCDDADDASTDDDAAIASARPVSSIRARCVMIPKSENLHRIPPAPPHSVSARPPRVDVRVRRSSGERIARVVHGPPRAATASNARACPPAFVRAAKGDGDAGADVFEKFPQSEKRHYAKDPVPRRVVVLCHGVTSRESAGLFSANNLLQGRVDVWCRCVSAALYLSDGIRRDTIVSLILRDGDGDGDGEKNDDENGEGGGGGGKCRVVSVNGGEVVGLAPDEATIARVLQRALQHASLDALSALGFSEDDDGDDDGGGGEKSPRNAERSAAPDGSRNSPAAAAPSPGSPWRTTRASRRASTPSCAVGNTKKTAKKGPFSCSTSAARR